jgi:hypothetical protein
MTSFNTTLRRSESETAGNQSYQRLFAANAHRLIEIATPDTEYILVAKTWCLAGSLVGNDSRTYRSNVIPAATSLTVGYYQVINSNGCCQR